MKHFLAGRAAAFRGDADVADWAARVVTNGGTVSTAERDAMETFVTGLKSGGHWSNITTLHCFVGDSDSAAKTWVKGGNDATSEGSVNMFSGTRYTRSAGFFNLTADSDYESVLGLGFSFDWNQDPDRPISFHMWGRNSGYGLRLGMHPNRTGASQQLFGYHESSYSYGYYMKPRRVDGGTQETGWNGPNRHDVSSVGFTFDGARQYYGRSRDADTGATGGSSVLLTGDTRDLTGLFYYSCDNPRLGAMIHDNVELSESNMDSINTLICSFVDDCGVTLTAVDPRA